MPPLFKMSLTVNKDVFEQAKSLPRKWKQALRKRILNELVPKIDKDANDLAFPGPLPVSVPFQFGTPKSKLYYLIMAHQTQGYAEHWERSGDIEKSFEAYANDRLEMTQVRVRNVHPKAKYVYGPWQVAGHRDTGWGKQADIIHDLLREEMVEWLRTAVVNAWKDAKAGRE